MAEELMEAAGLEAPEVDAGLDLGEPAEPVEQVAQPEGETKPGEEPKVDGRTLPQWLRNLKKSNPGEYSAAKDAYLSKVSYDERLKDFDLDGTKAFLEEHGGRESLASALTSLQERATQLDTIEQAVREARPEVINDIVEAAGENFPKIAAAMMNKWAENNPENYGAAIDGAFAQTIANTGMPMFLERMTDKVDMLKDFAEMNPQVAQNSQFVRIFNALSEQVGSLKQWAGSFAARAKEVQAPKPGQPAAKTESAEDVRKQVAHDKWRDETVALRNSMIEAELKHFVASNPDPGLQKMVSRQIAIEVHERMSADNEYVKNINALTDRGEYKRALDLFKSRESRAVSDIAPGVAKMVYKSGPAAPAKTQPAKPAAPARPKTPAAVSSKNKFDAFWDSL